MNKPKQHTLEKGVKFNQQAGLFSAIVTGFINAGLTAIFYKIAIGSLEDIFNADVGFFASTGFAIGLGVVMSIVEAIVNVKAKLRGKMAVTHWLIVLAFIFINVGAGMYRTQSAALHKENTAKKNIGSDPRYSSILDDREAAQGMLKNGTAKDDPDAMLALERIAGREQALSKEYAEGSRVDIGHESIFFWILAISFLLVNIIYSIAIKSAMSDEDDYEYIGVERTENHNGYNGMGFNRQQNLQPAYAEHSPPPPESHPQKRKFPAGFQGVDGITKHELRIKNSEPEIDEPPPIITKNSQPETQKRDWEKIRQMGSLTGPKSKQNAMRKLRRFIDKNPNATQQVMGHHIGKDLKTVRQYLKELGLK